MEVEIKFKSIAVNWLIKIFLPISIIITVLAISLCLIVNSIYIEKVKSAASETASSFSLLASCEPTYFTSAAKEYCEQFSKKEQLEIQIINNQGNCLFSTSGFESIKAPMPDYEKALASKNGSAYVISRSPEGERVLSGTYILADYGSGSNGAVRYLVSLSPAISKTTTYIIIIIAVSLSILLFSGVSGIFFIKNISSPIREVSAAARKIASGGGYTEIKANRNDEIGELCDTLNFMASELENADNLKNDFISSVSHELRTPLTAIKGWGETAKMAVGNDDELVSRGLDVILGESERLSALVEELLDFSRMQNGKLSLNMRPFNISSVLYSAAAMYMELAKKQGVELTYIIPKNDSVVLGDPDRIKQVFINIIDNAVKYTGEKGQVLIEQITEEACVRISVKDTGIGIPEKDIDHVKEKFYKANKMVRGSGIGLSVSDEIIKQHNGLLFVESTENIGTTVTVVLPTIEPTYEEEPTADTIEDAVSLNEVALNDENETIEKEEE